MKARYKHFKSEEALDEALENLTTKPLLPEGKIYIDDEKSVIVFTKDIKQVAFAYDLNFRPLTKAEIEILKERA